MRRRAFTLSPLHRRRLERQALSCSGELQVIPSADDPTLLVQTHQPLTVLDALTDQRSRTDRILAAIWSRDAGFGSRFTPGSNIPLWTIALRV